MWIKHQDIKINDPIYLTVWSDQFNVTYLSIKSKKVSVEFGLEEAVDLAHKILSVSSLKKENKV